MRNNPRYAPLFQAWSEIGPGVSRATLKSLDDVDDADDSRRVDSPHASASRSGRTWISVDKRRRRVGETGISTSGVDGCEVWKNSRGRADRALPREVYGAGGRAVRSAHDSDRLLLLSGVIGLALCRLRDVGDADGPVDATALGDGD